MAQHTQLPLWRDAFELSVQIERAVQRFSRYHKYALGADLRSSTRLLLRAITLAARKDAIALHARREVILLAEQIRAELALAHALKAFPCLQDFATAVALVGAVGKQSEGWLKQAKRERPAAAPAPGAARA